jgi:heat shock protein HslJ
MIRGNPKRGHGRRGGVHRPIRPVLGLLATAVMLLTACGGGGAVPTPTGSVGGEPSPSGSSGGDPIGSWALREGSGPAGPIVLVDDFPITLEVIGSRITGRACNDYGATIVPVGDGIELRELAMTAMACVDERIMAAEAAYGAALEGVRRIAMEGEELVLTGPGISLRFGRLPEVPTAELVGTTWTLESVFVGDVAASPLGEPATLLLREDGTFSGSTGCRAFDGAWIEATGQIQATSMAMDQTECPADIAGQDSHVVSVIGDGFVPTVEGQLLTLTDPGGIGLVYRASE